MGKRIRNLCLFVVVLTIIYALISLFFRLPENSGQEGVDADLERRGLFSWESAALEESGTEIFAFMKQHGFTEVYQWFSGSLDRTVITAFLRNAEAEGIAVYMLTGDPSWARDAGGERLLQRVDNAVQINQLYGGAGGGIKGMMFDVEPYVLEEWKTDADSIMTHFVEVMGKVYQETAQKNLEVILCLPNYYDSKGYEAELDALIRTGCDRAAIMNYYKEKEVEKIETEAACALKYGKGCISIYEFQAPGDFAINEVNTYYYEGLEAVKQNFDELKSIYPDIDMAAHNYEGLKEVVERREYRPEAGEEIPD